MSLLKIVGRCKRFVIFKKNRKDRAGNRSVFFVLGKWFVILVMAGFELPLLFSFYLNIFPPPYPSF